jgi:pyridoxamine 5'-phosphate oxidase
VPALPVVVAGGGGHVPYRALPATGRSTGGGRAAAGAGPPAGVGEDGGVTGDTPDLARMRRDYPIERALDESGLTADWATQFAAWLADAVAAGVEEPNAMILATADAAGRPSARTVLLKGVDRGGFEFFTNLRSRKATEALHNPYASLVFCWHPLHRQVVVCGAIETVPRPEVERYFAGRPRGAQLGAWASPQSQVIRSRQVLDDAFQAAAARFAGAERVPAPPHWGGLRVVPETVEFWQGRTDRLHDRLRFRRGPGGHWVVERLAP